MIPGTRHTHHLRRCPRSTLADPGQTQFNRSGSRGAGWSGSGLWVRRQ